MAKIELLQKRIDSFTQKIEKANSTIVRYNKTIDKKIVELKKKYNFNYANNKLYTDELESMGYSKQDAWSIYWLMCDIDSSKESIKDRERDIKDYTSSLNKYKEELSVEISKDNSRDIKVILDFLEQWKCKVFDYYVNHENGLVDMNKDKDYVESLRPSNLGMDYTWEYSSDIDKRNSYLDALKLYKEESARFKRDCFGVKERVDKYYNYKKTETGKYEFTKQFWRGTLEDDINYLNAVLTEEVKHKYDDLVNRVCAIVGTITDVSNLSVGFSGDLNGYIDGTNGRAKVETIGAGGYNIQVYHFRTLVHKINK